MTFTITLFDLLIMSCIAGGIVMLWVAYKLGKLNEQIYVLEAAQRKIGTDGSEVSETEGDMSERTHRKDSMVILS